MVGIRQADPSSIRVAHMRQILHYAGGMGNRETDGELIARLGGTREGLSRGSIRYPTCGRPRGRGGRDCDRKICDSNWHDFGRRTDELEAWDKEGDQWKAGWTS